MLTQKKISFNNDISFKDLGDDFGSNIEFADLGEIIVGNNNKVMEENEDPSGLTDDESDESDDED